METHCNRLRDLFHTYNNSDETERQFWNTGTNSQKIRISIFFVYFPFRRPEVHLYPIRNAICKAAIQPTQQSAFPERTLHPLTLARTPAWMI